MQHDWVQLHSEPIAVGPVVEFVTDPMAGGIAVFLGTTRAEDSQRGEALAALEYEAYEEMALRQLQELAVKAREQWPILRLCILHRTGRVAVGEQSVVIAVSTPHRAEAFAACRWLIDALKAEAAIWKKELWTDGSGSWVHPEGDQETRGRGDTVIPARRDRLRGPGDEK